ncbi:PadR family transcriptional regulator [Paenibacillus turpanensis]|uniref:PadR family transcriptional regulator n=1 Tax=Paenibacillus turpanensis TaxID=2689078 RepID=UPI001409FCB4|nr:PadR family transcriptional regulator [Paenibacillus turpanensis]
MKHHNHRFGHLNHSDRRRLHKEEAVHELYLKHRHGGSRGGFGGRGEGKRFFERGKFKFALLELLSAEPMHGYQLIKAMEEKTGGLYVPSPGSVYPNLQLLEDMQLIGSSETDGKKLYHITNEGLAYLRDHGNSGTEEKEEIWGAHDRHHRHRRGGFGKHQLRGFMKEWSDVIYLMASAAEAAKENPSSKQAQQFQELMGKFQKSLKEIASETSNPGSDEDVTPGM